VALFPNSAYKLLPLISMLVSYTLLRLLLSPRAPMRFLDHPNERSLHRAPLPRTGGIAITLGILAGTIWIAGLRLPLAGALALAGISLIDDWKGLSQIIRLALHLAVAATFVVFIAPGMSVLAQSLLIVAVSWMTNLYNFMDGSDGLAGGMAITGFGFYTFGAWFSGDSALAWFCACVVCASAPFLLFNFSPSKIFLGDAGSIPLGFLAGALGVLGWQRGDWTLWFPLLVFSPFVVDASVTLGRRLLRKERIWQAHRDHYYQRVVRLGWSHRKTALVAYVVMLAAGFLGLLEFVDAAGISHLVIAAAMYLLIGLLIDRAWNGRSSLDRT
jgi:UDP-GlcNAc:undecaprenyl-phosphate/decaprenyl-phosphate GlcNAc-1-phosphate transferase